MTLFSDTFTRSGALRGSGTDAGSGVWSGTGSPTTNGSRAVLPGGSSAFLVAGAGDGDLTAQQVSGSTGGIFLRGDAAGAGGWRLENYTQTYDSGGYQTRTNYVAQYRVGGSVTDSRDDPVCPDIGSLSAIPQCDNNNYAQSYNQSCGSYGSYVTYYLQGVYVTGTCQVYVGGSYSVAYTRLINPAGTVVWSGQSNSQPTLRLRAQGSSVVAWVDGTQVFTATDSDAASRSRNSHGMYSASGAVQFDGFSLDTLNTAPNAPVITFPANNSVVDRTQVVTLAWTFNDPDPNDRQSKFDLQIRKVGETVWVPISRETPTTSFANAANNFADGAQFEWQVRTYDSQGIVGPWSATSYFRAGTPPPAPTWLDPTDGGQIPTEQFTARWSSASQVLYELQVLPEVNGAPDLNSPAYTSGTVRSVARTAVLTFPANNVVRYLRLRIQAGDLWSQWATVRATVSYTPPATPIVLVLADELQARILVDVRTLKPTGTQPAVRFLDLYRQAGSDVEQRVATAIAPGGRWIDWTPASGVEHRYRAVAYGANGVTSTSAPTA